MAPGMPTTIDFHFDFLSPFAYLARFLARRVFGVPTMLLGAQTWRGNDRLFMLDQALAARA